MGIKKTKANKPTEKSNADNEFDVKRNLQKLKSGRSSTNYVTGQQTRRTTRSQEPLTNESQNDSYSTSDLLGLNDNMHLRYDKLKDDFNSEIKELKSDYSTFARDFTEKYISKVEFWIIVGGLLTILTIIGSLFYTLSYQGAINDINTMKKSIEEIRINDKTATPNSKVDTTKK